MDKLQLKALTFAENAHSGQMRKYSEGEHYIQHPIRVARIVDEYDSSDAMICAALLHDVVEDSETTVEDLEKEFGKEISSLVSDLTNTTPKTAGKRSERHKLECERIRGISNAAKTIKCADAIDNLGDISEKADPDYAKLYCMEKDYLLHHSLLGADPLIWERLHRLIEDIKKGF